MCWEVRIPQGSPRWLPGREVWAAYGQPCVGLNWGYHLREDGAVLGISWNILILSVKLKQPISHEAVLDLSTQLCPLIGCVLCCRETLGGVQRTELLTSQFCCSFLLLCFKMGPINTFIVQDLVYLITSPLSLHGVIAWLPQGSVLMKGRKICSSGVTPTWSNFLYIFAILREIQSLKLFSANLLEVASVCRSSYLHLWSEWDCISHPWEMQEAPVGF